jgi:hypothetical protein
MFGLMLDPDEKQLLPYKGRQVCLLMKDGSRKIGKLTGCVSGRLILNGEAQDAAGATLSRKTTARRQDRRRRKPQNTSAPQVPQQDAIWGDFSGGFPEGFSDDFSLAPLGMDPMFASNPKEKVPLNTVESILIL